MVGKRQGSRVKRDPGPFSFYVIAGAVFLKHRSDCVILLLRASNVLCSLQRNTPQLHSKHSRPFITGSAYLLYFCSSSHAEIPNCLRHILAPAFPSAEIPLLPSLLGECLPIFQSPLKSHFSPGHPDEIKCFFIVHMISFSMP